MPKSLSSQVDLWKSASKIKRLKKVDLPLLDVWNYFPCEHHDIPTPMCEYQACGGEPFPYQTVAATYHLKAKKSLNTSQPGTGKSAMIMLTLALYNHKFTMPRAILVVPTVSVEQWKHESKRWAPGFRIEYIPKGCTKSQRMEYYTKYNMWDILIIGYHSFVKDVDSIENIPVDFAVADDVDPLHNIENKTHKAFVRVADKAPYVIVANATPTQTHLLNLFGATTPIGAQLVWGNKTQFEREHIRREPVWIAVGKDHEGNVIMRRTMPMVGYKNMDKLAAEYKLMHVRYTYAEVADSVVLPEIVSHDVLLDLHPKQRKMYDLLQEGLFEVLNNKTQTVQQKRITALAKFVRGSQICAGLQSLGMEDGPGLSSKIDWTVDNILSSFEENKVVVYAQHRGTIKAIQNRLRKEKVDYATIDGSTKDKRGQQQKFWENEECRVMLLSAAGERSLNLQCADVLIMLDSPWNPARVQQIAGRLRRTGSKHATVRVFRLTTVDTQEERVAKVLASRQIVADTVNGEEDESNLFQALDPEEILQLIKP